uniref:C-type lectin domain-containing protein n=1 Tax=Cyprinus carpio TaxID=7962 RepID=A0A8C1I8Z2_CYPCA
RADKLNKATFSVIMSDYKRLEISEVIYESVSRTEFQDTDRGTVEMINYRAAVVCLVLLCVLLLTAVIVLCVHIHTNNTNCTEERNELLTRNTNLTEEREQLLTTITNLMKQIEQLNEENNDLVEENEVWKCYKSSLYYLSSERKSWTESKRYCTERGTNLIIINNREEQVRNGLLMVLVNNRVWIGLTDSDVEGRWKWVDGSIPTSWFWMPAEPNGSRRENCALTIAAKWADHPCTEEFNWMCERNTV